MAGQLLYARDNDKKDTITQAISSASCEIAARLNAKTIISSTQSGHTARQVAKNRPHSLIIGASPHDYVVRQLMVSWGVIPVKTKFVGSISEIINEAIETAKKEGYVQSKDTVVITAGILVNKPGSTNFINVKKID
ncbi:MAG: pyruvate kinase alpha/beta domain-containing protein [Actinomycetota bacterium]|nr:pyruvate kinase alpha/beta domain-containing protein [Actinomycetota bacterium]